MGESRPPHARTEEHVLEWGRSLLWLTLLALPVVFSARTTESFELPKVALFRAVAILLAVGGVARVVASGLPGLRARAGRSLGLIRDPIAVGVLAWWVSATVSTLASMSPRTSLLGAERSFAGLFTVTAYVVFFVACRALGRTPAHMRGILQGASLGLGLTVAYGFLQVAGLDPVRWQAPVAYSDVARLFSTLGHPNALAQYLAMAAPVALVAAVASYHGRRLGEATALGVVAAGAVALVVLTLSRAGILALLVGGLVLLSGLASGTLASRRWARGALLALGLAMLAIAVTSRFDAGAGVGHMAKRLGAAAEARFVEDDPRLPIWAAAGRIFRDHPVVGSGLETLSLVYGRYRTPEGWSSEWGQTPLKAHNQILDLLATRGLLGLVGPACFVLGFLQAGLRAPRSPDPWLTCGALAGLAAFAVHNLFHFPSAATTTLALALLAALVVTPEEHAAETAAPAPWLIGAGLVGFGLVYVGVVRPLRADRMAQAGTVLTRTDPASAAAHATAATAMDPTRPLLWLRRSAAFQALARGRDDRASRTAAFIQARGAADRAIGLSPLDTYAHAHLGTLLADMEREEAPLATRAEVQAAFGRAHALDPANADVLLAAAVAALAAGDHSQAATWAAQSLRLYPRFAPPRGVLGAVLLAEARGLAAAGRQPESKAKAGDAANVLREALAADWRGDLLARDSAERNLEAAEAERR